MLAATVTMVAALATTALAFQPQMTGNTKTWSTSSQYAGLNNEFKNGGTGSAELAANWDTQMDGWIGTAPSAFDDSAVVQKWNMAIIGSTYNTTFFPAGLPADCNCGFENYKTGMMISKKAIKHGFLEVKAKISDTKLVNAIWLQGAKSEINILEYTGAAKTATSNFHCWDTTENSPAQQQEQRDYPAGKITFTKDIHTYGMHKTADAIKIYLDGTLVRTIAKNVFSASHPDCMDEEMNVILSTETVKDNLPGKFGYTANFQIDYVRFWDQAATSTTAAPTTASPGNGNHCVNQPCEKKVASAKSCEELGWTKSAVQKDMSFGYDTSKVCSMKSAGYQQNNPNNCDFTKDATNKKTKVEAIAFCEAAGARLCYAKELKANVQKKIGCNKFQRTYHHVLDAPPADNKYGTNGLLVSWGFQNTKKKPDLVVYKKSKRFVRCCADFAGAPKVGEAAKQESSATGSASFEASASALEASDADADTDEGSDGADTGMSAGMSTLLGFGVAMVVVAGAIATVFAAKGGHISAPSSDLEGGAVNQAEVNSSFEDTADAVSEQSHTLADDSGLY